MLDIFRPRRGKKSTMASTKATLVLRSGELFLEYPDAGVGKGRCKMKIGDGTTQYSTLPYALGDIGTISRNGTALTPDANDNVNIVVPEYSFAVAAKNATQGNAKIRLTDSVNNKTNDILIKGAGSVSVTTDANGYVIITGTDENNVYTHPTSGVTAGTYTQVVVDANGHVTSGSNPTLSIAKGGTGATDAAGARTALGLAYGTAAGTVCQGNDSRLSDARTPKSHTHATSDITNLSTFVTSTIESTDFDFGDEG